MNDGECGPTRNPDHAKNPGSPLVCQNSTVFGYRSRYDPLAPSLSEAGDGRDSGGGSTGVDRGTGATASVQERPSVPYVDGLSFLSPDAQDVGRSGLTSFICDVSSVERLPTTDGSIK